MRFFWYFAAIIATIITGIIYAKSKRDELKSKQRIHEIQFSTTEYKYNRFNTKSFADRVTSIERKGDKISIHSDIEKISVTDENLLSIEVLSQVELYLFKLLIEVPAFDIEHLTSTNKALDKKIGELKITGYGVESAVIIMRLNELLDLNLSSEFALRKVSLKILSVKRIPSNNLIVFYCIDNKNEEFEISFNHKDQIITAQLDLNWLNSNQIKKLV